MDGFDVEAFGESFETDPAVQAPASSRPQHHALATLMSLMLAPARDDTPYPSRKKRKRASGSK